MLRNICILLLLLANSLLISVSVFVISIVALGVIFIFITILKLVIVFLSFYSSHPFYLYPPCAILPEWLKVSMFQCCIFTDPVEASVKYSPYSLPIDIRSAVSGFVPPTPYSR